MGIHVRETHSFGPAGGAYFPAGLPRVSGETRAAAYLARGETCGDCGAAYTLTVADQELHERRAFTDVPARCPDCRAGRRATRGHYSSPQGRSGWL